METFNTLDEYKVLYLELKADTVMDKERRLQMMVEVLRTITMIEERLAKEATV